MSQKTIIAWTDHTFNPWWGCVKVSEGCRNCYAAALADRYGQRGLWGSADGPRREFGREHWSNPIKWDIEAAAEKRTRRVFCGSMMDWAEPNPTAAKLRPLLFDLIRATPNLQWQLLTKRPHLIRESLPADWGGGYPNVWLGTSIESMKVAGRADDLRDIPATVRFISYEPALGPLDDLDLAGIDWLIFGGESGPKYRPMNIEWARSIRQKCAAAGTAFFFKQSAAYRTETGIELDGHVVRNYPELRWVPPVSPCAQSALPIAG